MSTPNHAIKLLHQNELGYIGRCPCCNEIQFTLGTILSHLPEENFYFFLESIRKIAVGVEDRFIQTPVGKRVLLRTPVQEILISLSPEAFFLAKDLLEQAACLLEAHSLLNTRNEP